MLRLYNSDCMTLRLSENRFIIVGGAVALLLVAFLVVSAVFGGDEAASPDEVLPRVLDPEQRSEVENVVLIDAPQEGSIVWVHDQEPVSLHASDPDNLGSNSAFWIQQGLLEGLYGVGSDLDYYPELLAEDGSVTEGDGDNFSVSYILRDNIFWSDGEPITTADVEFTFNAIVEGCETESDGTIKDNTNDGCFFKINSRRGYSQISDFEIVSDTEFKVSFESAYPDWRSLFEVVFAEHAYGDNALDINAALEDLQGGELPVSGPLKLQSWDRGATLTLEPNDNYHGSVARHDFVIEFVPNVSSVKANLEAGNGHFALTDVDTLLADFDNDGIVLAATGGAVWEHVGMNLANDHLENVLVREALAAAVDKVEIVEQLYTPLFGETLAAEGLGNSFVMPNQPGYVSNQTSGVDAAIIESNMLAEGYTKNLDGVWEHPERGAVGLRLATTAADSFRLAQQQLVIEQLTAAGFATEANNFGGADFFTTSQNAEGPFASKANWDLVMFAWSGGPWPGGQVGTYGGKASANNVNNIYGYSRTDFDAAAKECSSEYDRAIYFACFAELDAFATTNTGESGSFIIPISQKPSFFAYNATLITVPEIIDYPSAGPFINPSNYTLN